jgi:CHAD domain-containing protein
LDGFEGSGVCVALRSAIVGEFEAALAQLAAETEEPGGRVHRARKHLKRWRALVALLPHESAEPLGRVSSVVRLVARRLGTIRDPVAQLETWQKFASRLRSSIAAAAIGQHLEQRCREQIVQGTVERRVRRAARALRAAHSELRRVLELPPETGEPAAAPTTGAIQLELESRRALLRGVGRAYRRARKAFGRAHERENDDRLHALRRANKAHQYQLQFLEPFWHKPLKAQRAELGTLSDQLGEHHDLTTMQRWLGATPLDDDLSECLQHVDGWRRELAARAIERAALAYSERPRAIRQRISGYIEARTANVQLS